MKDTTLHSTSLNLSIETGKNKWLLTISPGGKGRRRIELQAGGLTEFKRQVGKALRHFGLPQGTRVICCYEAGRDGFWIHRALTQLGYTVYVIDAASIELPQRRRRKKTDRIDGEKLLRLLLRYESGETDSFAVVRVPSEEDEDARRPQRELERLMKERLSHASRIESLLALQGVRAKVSAEFAKQLPLLRRWDGSPLGAELETELAREYQRYEVVARQITALLKERAARLKAAQEAQKVAAAQKGKGRVDERQERTQRRHEKVLRLSELRGIGAHSAWKLVTEFFGWRDFKNGRQVGGLAGLTGTPYNSGESERDQGISKEGNRRVRTLMVELAWSWLRYQPDSKITKWFEQRCLKGKRKRRQSIVAVARQLLVALWRYVQFGEVPEGAELKPCARAA
jgi:transposase